MELDVESSSVEKLKSYCEECFPLDEENVPLRGKYVDLLEFSNFNGIPYPVTNPANKPRRFLADFRYSWSVPLIHDYPFVECEVLSSSRVQNAISKLAKIDGKPEKLHHRAIDFLTEIRSRLSKWICKCCSYILYKVFRRLMDKLLVCPEEMKQLQHAEQTGIPLVYLPLHRSHLDYLLITWCNWHFGIKLPHIASGDNLNLCGLGWLLRATGAFFIRRRVDPCDERGKDMLYRAILHSYIEHILSKNLPIEFFLEGTRSRFGKVLTPKNGLISNVVEAVQHGFIEDCYLVPVSYTYDAVVEGVFLNELMGVPKVRESVFGVFKGLLTGFSQSKQCGVVRMHYGRPILLTEYLSAITASLVPHRSRPVRMTKLPTSFSYRELVPWHRSHSETVDDRSMIRAIGFHVVYEAQMMCSISPVAVISCVILAKWRRKISRKIFENDCEWLCEQIVAEGGDVVGYQSKQTKGRQISEYAFKMLKSCVEVDEETVSPKLDHSSFIQLAYNKNSVICRFSIKSVAAISIISRSMDEAVKFDDVVEDTLSLCDWLQFEFLFCRPCENLRSLVKKVIRDWTTPIHGLLTMKEEDDVFADSGDFSRPQTLCIRDAKSREILMFYSNLVRPFVQSLYLLCNFICARESCADYPNDNHFIRALCQDALAGNVELPFSPLLESINSDSFKNALRVLKDKSFVEQNGTKLARNNGVAQLRELINHLERVLKVPEIQYLD